jgi:CubicO group peptidase (beta-lactamase class C family)
MISASICADHALHEGCSERHWRILVPSGHELTRTLLRDKHGLRPFNLDGGPRILWGVHTVIHSRQSRRDFLKTASAVAATTSFAGGVGSSGVARATTSSQTVALANIDKAFQQAVDAKKLPGVVAIAANERGIIYEGAVGKRDMANGPDMSLDTIFWIASMTKAVTATAAMQLVEQGKLDLEKPIGTLLPDLAKPQVLEGFDASGAPMLRPAKRLITLRHLLTHTAGFTYSIWSAPMLQFEKVTHIPFIGSCETASLKAPLMFDPGDRWEYGINMDWVGKAVEAVSDQSLEIYFREHIFQPLDMVDTGFLIGSKQKPRVATMYQRDDSGALKVKPFEMPQSPEFFMGGGALFSTPRDYIRFLQMLLNDGSFSDVQLLKPETVALMRQNHIGDLRVRMLKTVQPDLSYDADFFPQMVEKWGLSFDINTEPGPAGRSAGSLCWAGLFNTYFWIDPTKRVTGTIMTQILPFVDPTVMQAYDAFERGVYSALQAT